MGSTIIKNIGMILSGDIEHPVLDGDTIVITDKKIAAVGNSSVADGVEADKVIDAAGATVAPVSSIPMYIPPSGIMPTVSLPATSSRASSTAA